jgi:hypothetical protein
MAPAGHDAAKPASVDPRLVVPAKEEARRENGMNEMDDI